MNDGKLTADRRSSGFHPKTHQQHICKRHFKKGQRSRPPWRPATKRTKPTGPTCSPSMARRSMLGVSLDACLKVKLLQSMMRMKPLTCSSGSSIMDSRDSRMALRMSTKVYLIGQGLTVVFKLATHQRENQRHWLLTLSAQGHLARQRLPSNRGNHRLFMTFSSMRFSPSASSSGGHQRSTVVFLYT